LPKWPSVGQSSGREPYRQNAGACERWRGRPSGTVAERRSGRAPDRAIFRVGESHNSQLRLRAGEAVCRQAPRAGAPEPRTGQDMSRTLERLTGGTALNQAPAFVDAERSSCEWPSGTAKLELGTADCRRCRSGRAHEKVEDWSRDEAKEPSARPAERQNAGGTLAWRLEY